MSCGFYDEVKNGLKMSIPGAAVGALVWFVAGSGVKESYAKRQREREKERLEHDRARERERAAEERERRKEEREREKEARPEPKPRRGADGGTFASSFSWKESL